MMKRFLSALVATAMLTLSTAPSYAAAGGNQQPSSAGEDSLNVTGKRVKIVAKSGVYGFAGGLVVGLASQVFKKKAKNIFLFGSLGLYAGIILGVYVISTSSGPAPYEGPDTYEDFSSQLMKAPSTVALSDARVAKPDLQFNFLNVKF